MIGGLANALMLQEDDITKMLAATTHIGSENSETTMEQYVFKKRNNGKQSWQLITASRNSIFFKSVCTSGNVLIVVEMTLFKLFEWCYRRI